MVLGATLLFGTAPMGGAVAGNASQWDGYAQLPDATEEAPTRVEDGVEEPRFSCALVDGEYTVMYHPQSQPGQSYAWATPTELGSGWTPERRCNEIARRLELYRPDGLVELGTSVENEYDIICVTTQDDPSCRIVLTVPPGQDPQQTRDLVFDNIVTADSGRSTAAVSALRANGADLDTIEDLLGIDLSDLEDLDDLSGLDLGTRSRINLQPFLDATDGGTGEMLQDGISTPGNPKLNPDNFR